MKIGSVFAMVLLVGYPYDAFAQGPGLRPMELRPRIGEMSEEVVREKFNSYGVQITKLERHKDMYIAHAQIEGKPAVLELNRLTGALKHQGKSLRLQPSPDATRLAIKPNPKRVPWMQRTIRFEKMGVEGIRLPARPINR